MSGDTLRERVADAILEAAHDQWLPESADDLAAAALAVVADAPGLEEVLRAHRLNFDMHGDSCQADDWTEDFPDTFEAHQAAVVRAWLRGEHHGVEHRGVRADLP